MEIYGLVSAGALNRLVTGIHLLGRKTKSQRKEIWRYHMETF